MHDEKTAVTRKHEPVALHTQQDRAHGTHRHRTQRHYTQRYEQQQKATHCATKPTYATMHEAVERRKLKRATHFSQQRTQPGRTSSAAALAASSTAARRRAATSGDSAIHTREHPVAAVKSARMASYSGLPLCTLSTTTQLPTGRRRRGGGYTGAPTHSDGGAYARGRMCVCVWGGGVRELETECVCRAPGRRCVGGGARVAWAGLGKERTNGWGVEGAAGWRQRGVRGEGEQKRMKDCTPPPTSRGP